MAFKRRSIFIQKGGYRTTYVGIVIAYFQPHGTCPKKSKDIKKISKSLFTPKDKRFNWLPSPRWYAAKKVPIFCYGAATQSYSLQTAQPLIKDLLGTFD
jgi:hypothetical protein